MSLELGQSVNPNEPGAWGSLSFKMGLELGQSVNPNEPGAGV